MFPVNHIFQDITRLGEQNALDTQSMGMVPIATPSVWVCGFSCTSISALNPGSRQNRTLGLWQSEDDMLAGTSESSGLSSTSTTWAWHLQSAITGLASLFQVSLQLCCSDKDKANKSQGTEKMLHRVAQIDTFARTWSSVL